MRALATMTPLSTRLRARAVPARPCLPSLARHDCTRQSSSSATSRTAPPAASNDSTRRSTRSSIRSAKIEVLGEGYLWSEGPVWVPAGGFLLFSDIPNNAVMK